MQRALGVAQDGTGESTVRHRGAAPPPRRGAPAEVFHATAGGSRVSYGEAPSGKEVQRRRGATSFVSSGPTRGLQPTLEGGSV
eukprot:11406516-Alexandrium_andersonii.AAC.1